MNVEFWLVRGLSLSFTGIDDARNIARVAIRMLEDGCDIQMNERIFRNQLRKHVLGEVCALY